MKKKQERTYGPSGLMEIRLRKLMTEDNEVEMAIYRLGAHMLPLYEKLRKHSWSDEDCYQAIKRVSMVTLGRYMEEDTDYSLYEKGPKLKND